MVVRVFYLEMKIFAKLFLNKKNRIFVVVYALYFAILVRFLCPLTLRPFKNLILKSLTQTNAEIKHPKNFTKS